MNVAVDGQHLDCNGAMMGGLHTVHSRKADHETCMDDSSHAVADKMMPSNPAVLILD